MVLGTECVTGLNGVGIAEATASEKRFLQTLVIITDCGHLLVPGTSLAK